MDFGSILGRTRLRKYVSFVLRVHHKDQIVGIKPLSRKLASAMSACVIADFGKRLNGFFVSAFADMPIASAARTDFEIHPVFGSQTPNDVFTHW